MKNPFRRKYYKGMIRIKKKDILYRPKTHLKCVKCGKIQTIDGTVFGTDPIFVGMDRRCKKCGYHLFNRITQVDI